MSKTIIVTIEAIETISKTAEVVVQVPEGIGSREVEELVMSLDLANHPYAEWQVDYQDFEVHAAQVTEQIEEEECGTPDVVIERVGERCEARVND